MIRATLTSFAFETISPKTNPKVSHCKNCSVISLFSSVLFSEWQLEPALAKLIINLPRALRNYTLIYDFQSLYLSFRTRIFMLRFAFAQWGFGGLLVWDFCPLSSPMYVGSGEISFYRRANLLIRLFFCFFFKIYCCSLPAALWP